MLCRFVTILFVGIIFISCNKKTYNPSSQASTTESTGSEGGYESGGGDLLKKKTLSSEEIKFVIKNLRRHVQLWLNYKEVQHFNGNSDYKAYEVFFKNRPESNREFIKENISGLEIRENDYCYVKGNNNHPKTGSFNHKDDGSPSICLSTKAILESNNFVEENSLPQIFGILIHEISHLVGVKNESKAMEFQQEAYNDFKNYLNLLQNKNFNLDDFFHARKLILGFEDFIHYFTAMGCQDLGKLVKERKLNISQTLGEFSLLEPYEFSGYLKYVKSVVGQTYSACKKESLSDEDNLGNIYAYKLMTDDQFNRVNIFGPEFFDLSSYDGQDDDSDKRLESLVESVDSNFLEEEREFELVLK